MGRAYSNPTEDQAVGNVMREGRRKKQRMAAGSCFLIVDKHGLKGGKRTSKRSLQTRMRRRGY